MYQEEETQKATVQLGKGTMTVEGDTAKFVNKVAIAASAALAVICIIKAFRS
jgi:hypothetical protein